MQGCSILQEIVNLAPLLREVIGDEYVITVSDTEKFIYYSPGTELNHNIKPGDPIKPGSMTHRCLEAGRRLVTTADSKLYGVPYIGTITCVRDESNNIVGTLGLSLPTTNIEKLNSMAEKMASSIGQIMNYATNLSAAAEELASTVQNINSNTQQMLKDVNNTDGILQLINDVSSQTHLLGLNAAIEAARAGDQGRGFNVVAEEIRKLASRTNTSVKDIKEIIAVIKSHIEALAVQISEIAAVTEEQAATSMSVMNSIQDIEGVADALKDLASRMFTEK